MLSTRGFLGVSQNIIILIKDKNTNFKIIVCFLFQCFFANISQKKIVQGILICLCILCPQKQFCFIIAISVNFLNSWIMVPVSLERILIGDEPHSFSLFLLPTYCLLNTLYSIPLTASVLSLNMLAIFTM